MKIGFFGDGPWSHLALRKLISDGHEIAFITPRYETQDPVLKEISDYHNIEWALSDNVNKPDFLDYAQKLSCDLFVSMSFNQIIQKDLTKATPNGFINCHAGALPYYKGRNPINWAIINGEEYIGITAHYIDDGIDTGKIIQQDFIRVHKKDDYGTLLDKGFSQCAETLSRAVHKIVSESPNPINQKEIHSTGFYCTKRIEGDEYIDWNKSTKDIHNFIRAITRPAPGARTRSRTHDLIILKSSLPENNLNYIATPGEIVGSDFNNWHVKTGDSILLLDKNNIEWSSGSQDPVKLKIGDRIGLTFGDLIEAILG